MSPMRRMLLIVALTCMWSPSFFFIKLAVQEMSPFGVAAARVTLSALLLTTLMLAIRQPFPKDAMTWARVAGMALFSSAAPFLLFSYAEQSITSSLAAMMNGTTPMFTAVLAHFFVANDTMTRSKLLGITLSAGGLIWLLGPSVFYDVEASMGLLAALAASISYAISHVYGKKWVTGLAPFVAPTLQMISSSIMLLPIMVAVDRPWEMAMPSAVAWSGVCGLALLGTFGAFILYYRLLEVSGPTAISMVACFFPVVGMFLGWLLLDEVMTWSHLIAAVLIIGGVMIVNEVIDCRKLWLRLRVGFETPV